MAENRIATYLSTKEIAFKPGGEKASFEVNVINQSDRFATFQLELKAAGADDHRKPDWYSISPRVSSKKPPGDITQFQVLLLDTPVPGFVGMMNITVRIFSPELGEETRELLRLTLEQGTGSTPIKLTLPIRDFQVYPENQLDILVRVYNPAQLSTHVILKFTGLDFDWIINGDERQLQILPGKEAEIIFTGRLPATIKTFSQIYSFRIEATQSNGPPSFIEGTIEILPMGLIEFRVIPKQRRIPSKYPWLPSWKSEAVTYELEFENLSNLSQQIGVVVEGEDAQKCTLEFIPEQCQINPGETSYLQLVARSPRPWIGWRQKLWLEVISIISDQRINNPNPASHSIKLEVFPQIPLWFLLLGIPLLFWSSWSLSCFNLNNRYCGHQAAVNSVQLNGIASNLISGANDQTAMKWQVSAFSSSLPDKEFTKIGNAQKAVRVVRYKPVDNNWVAVGLENGEIKIWDLLSVDPRPLESFDYSKDDRVLALEFTNDSRDLFSGHGSGSVFQWNITPNTRESDGKKRPIRRKKLDFAVYALKFAGTDPRNLLIAGQNNQLVVWNLANNQVRSLPYRPGGQEDYIFSIDAAQNNPNLVATSDNQGYITLWNMQTCLEKNQPCDKLDEWFNGHGNKPIRSVALSANGCYLASGGDDGKVKLWALTKAGSRAGQFVSGQEVDHSFGDRNINSVDIQVAGKEILIASGSDDTQVRVKSIQRLPQLGCDTP